MSYVVPIQFVTSSHSPTVGGEVSTLLTDSQSTTSISNQQLQPQFTLQHQTFQNQLSQPQQNQLGIGDVSQNMAALNSQSFVSSSTIHSGSTPSSQSALIDTSSMNLSGLQQQGGQTLFVMGDGQGYATDSSSLGSLFELVQFYPGGQVQFQTSGGQNLQVQSLQADSQGNIVLNPSQMDENAQQLLQQGLVAVPGAFGAGGFQIQHADGTIALMQTGQIADQLQAQDILQDHNTEYLAHQGEEAHQELMEVPMEVKVEPEKISMGTGECEERREHLPPPKKRRIPKKKQQSEQPDGVVVNVKSEEYSDSGSVTPTSPKKKRRSKKDDASGDEKTHDGSVTPSQDDVLKKYACHECGKRFRLKVQVRQHHDIVHKRIRPYKCELCTMDFSCKGNYQKHIETKAHKEKERQLLVSVTDQVAAQIACDTQPSASGADAPAGVVKVTQSAMNSTNIATIANNNNIQMVQVHPPLNNVNNMIHSSPTPIDTNAIVTNGTDDNSISKPKKARSRKKKNQAMEFEDYGDEMSGRKGRKRMLPDVDEYERIFAELNICQIELQATQKQLEKVRRDTARLQEEREQHMTRIRSLNGQIRYKDYVIDTLKNGAKVKINLTLAEIEAAEKCGGLPPPDTEDNASKALSTNESTSQPNASIIEKKTSASGTNENSSHIAQQSSLVSASSDFASSTGKVEENIKTDENSISINTNGLVGKTDTPNTLVSDPVTSLMNAKMTKHDVVFAPSKMTTSDMNSLRDSDTDTSHDTNNNGDKLVEDNYNTTSIMGANGIKKATRLSTFLPQI